MKSFINTAWKDLGYQTYECNNCGQLWGFRNPDLGVSGHAWTTVVN